MKRLAAFITVTTVCLLRAYASESRLPYRAPVSLPVELADAPAADSIVVPAVPKPRKHGLVDRLVRYFQESNREHHSKAFDMSFIGGPYYSSDTKFGIGLVAAGLYRTSKTDTLLPPSEVSLYLKATTSMFFQFGVRGNHIFPHDAARINYDVNFASIATKFWGIGYYNNVVDDNEAKYKYLNSQARANFVWRMAEGFYVGPMATFDYVNGRDFHKDWLWEDQDDRTFNMGVGFTLQYDTRDFLSNAFRGFYIRLDQIFHPRGIGNHYAFTLTEFTMSSYHRIWNGGILAGNFHTRLTYGNTPWGMLSTFGGSDNMRGYFEGRYRDKGEFDFCLELRQHVWHRNGVVVWGGCGMVFPRISAMRWKMLLPNYGVGYRWEFKKRVNVRLDLGFGKHQTGVIFSINEAF